MTKEITKANILQELRDKLKLREFEISRFLFDETVVPVYSIGEHLRSRTSSLVQHSITGIGGVEFFSVPDTERWFLNGYTVVPMGAGAFTFAGVYFTRRPDIANFIYLDLTAAQTVSYTVNLPKVLVLDPRDKLGINIDGYTSPQDLRLYIDREVEIIR